jgi:hypothetical protein
MKKNRAVVDMPLELPSIKEDTLASKWRSVVGRRSFLASGQSQP